MKKYSIYILFILLMLFNNCDNISYRVNKKIYFEPLNSTFIDDNFYKCVIDSYNKINNTSVTYDTVLSDEELSKITSLTCNGKNKDDSEKIKDITGIENLFNLNSLNLNYNNIIDFDISSNTNLTKIFIEGNKINKLDTSLNKKIKTIYAMNNNISEVNIKGNTNLTYLVISNNKISNIDLTDSVYLNYADLGNNNLSNIDLSYNTNLTMLYINNNKLNSINVDNNIYLESLQLSSNNIDYIDVSNNTRLRYLYINSNKLRDIKFGNNKQLNDLYLYNNLLTDLNTSKLTQLRNFDINGNNNLINLNVENILVDNLILEDLENLTELNASSNYLSSLVIKGSGKLNKIELGSNIVNLNIDKSSIENINLSKCNKINTLEINNSMLSSVNLENNINLTKLSLENNRLSSIDLSKNNMLTFINLKGNNFSKDMEPLLIDSLINVSDLDEMVKLPNNINNLSSDIVLSNNLNISDNVIKVINGGKATIDINKFKNFEDTNINYRLMYFIDTIKISSDKYDLKKEYLFVGSDSNDEIINNITTDYASFEIINNVLYVKYNNQTLRSYPLVRVISNNLLIDNNYIIIDNTMEYNDFTNKFNVINGSYKIFNNNIEVINDKILSGMNLKIYYNDNEVFNYNIVNDTIDLSNLNIKDNKYIISSLSKVSDLKSKLNSQYNIIVTDKDNNILSDDDYLETNSRININYSNNNYEYTIVVMGDITGSGSIFIGDISKLYRYYKGVISLDEPFVIAGDVTYDGVIEINDIAKLYQYYKGVINSLE